MKMKKTILTAVLAVNVAILTYFIVNFAVLGNTTDIFRMDFGDWLENREYQDSDTFHRHVQNDLMEAMNYIGLRQMLEEKDGSLDLERTALVVQMDDGSISRYTMRDLIALGEEQGDYVYDGVSSWEEISDNGSLYHGSEEEAPRVKVLWALATPEDSGVGIDEDAWSVREQRIREIIRRAENETDEPLEEISEIPREEVLYEYTTEDLIELAKALRETGKLFNTPLFSEEWIGNREEELQSIRQNEPDTTWEVEETTGPAIDAPMEERTDTGSTERIEVPVDYSWEENQLRSRMIDCLNEARDAQKEWGTESLYREVREFLIDLQQYYMFRNRLDGTDSNLDYRITFERNGSRVVYNDPDLAAVAAVPKEKWNVYYLYDSAEHKTETTFPNWFWESMMSHIRYTDQMQFDAVTVEMGFNMQDLKYQDDYYEERASYEGYRHEVLSAMVICAVCAVLMFVSMVWLMFLSGHKAGVEGICLNAYDKLPTEIGAAGVILMGTGFCLLCWLGMETLNGYGYPSAGPHTVNLILIGCSVLALLLLYLILWVGFYGLIRRLKAHTLWKNSLIYRVVRWCWKPIQWCAGKIRKGMILFLSSGYSPVLFLIYFAINTVWCTNLRYGGGISVILFLLFNGAVGVLFAWRASQLKKVKAGVEKIANGSLNYQLPLNDLYGEAKELAVQINRISVGLKNAIGESVKNERMRTDLITNVSHDIKTPLTSIINYVDLLKRQNIEDPVIQGYIDVLDQKSQRLKTLTEDLVEASKASSGTLKLQLEKIDFIELINQTNGEFADRLTARSLTAVLNVQENPAYIMADGRYVWRILENLYRNVEKYAMSGSRVYIEAFEKIGRVFFVIKNVSEAPLNIKADELTERFIRGDVSRSTEGSGLGLSIAKDMTELMGGTFKIYLDGDLFRVTVSFAVVPENQTDLKEIEESIRRRVTEAEAGPAGAAVKTDDFTAGSAVFGQKADVKEKKKSRLFLPHISLPKRKKKHVLSEASDSQAPKQTQQKQSLFLNRESDMPERMDTEDTGDDDFQDE